MSQFVVPAALAGKAIIKTKKLLEDQLGYDFFGLVIKIVVFFVAAWVLEQYVRWSGGDSNVKLATTFGAIGGVPLFALSQWLLDLFRPKEIVQGWKYWDIVKITATLLVSWEAYNYYESRQSLNMKPSPFTIGVFGAIISILGIMAVPDLLKKIQELQMAVKK